METRWMYHTSGSFAELREASKGTCLIPMGCVEKHGLHMALGTDIMAASRNARVFFIRDYLLKYFASKSPGIFMPA